MKITLEFENFQHFSHNNPKNLALKIAKIQAGIWTEEHKLTNQ